MNALKGRTFVGAMAAALLAPLLAVSWSGVKASEGVPARPFEVRRLPVMVPPGSPTENPAPRLIVSPSTRRAYQLHPIIGSFTQESTLVSAFDLDSGQMITQAVVPNILRSFGPNAIDSEGKRIFLGASSTSNGPPVGIAVLDESSFAPGGTPQVALAPVPENPVYKGPHAIVGLRYEPRTSKLLMLLSPQRLPDNATLWLSRGRQPYTTGLAQWDAAPGKAPREEWFHLLRECSSGVVGMEVGYLATPFFSADGRAAQLVCGTGETGWQFVSVPLGADGRPLMSGAVVFSAPSSVEWIVADAVGQRTHLIAGQAYGATFDWSTQRLLGTFSVARQMSSSGVSPGFDPKTGRLYIALPTSTTVNGEVVERGGLLLLDGRLTPLPQALAFRELDEPAVHGSLEVDSQGSSGWPEVYVRGGPSRIAGHDHWRAFADPVPLARPSDDTLADRTDDVDEALGKTDRAYASEAAGYGARLLVVGGFVQREGISRWTGCGARDRELVAGGIRRSSLSNVGAGARADVLESDQGTQGDARDIDRCWPPSIWQGVQPSEPPADIGPASPGWEVDPAECSGDKTDGGGAASNSSATAEVECRLTGEQVEAVSRYPTLGLAGVQVGASGSVSALRREPARGIVSRVESSADSVVVEGVGSIGMIRSVAETSAKGRTPQEGDPPRSVWTVEVCGVKTLQFEQRGCEKPDQAVAALNEAGRGRVLFTRPKADDALMRGTPRGYLAAVQRDKGEASVAIVEHGDSNLAVPGLEIQVRDSVVATGIHRYVVHLAAVRTASVYGISQLPPDLLDVPPPASAVEVEQSSSDGDGGSGVDASETAGEESVLRVSVQPDGKGSDSPLTRIVEVLTDVARAGWQLFRRSLGELLGMAGIWSTFGLAAYLAARRRRMESAQ
ncbi:MAG: hypothetical protein M3394_00695 [Actinomycetota bacterium]|nr:hypothetical protein [Actinomycetota bacterium]